MPIATTEYTTFNDLKASGVVTTDTFNTWRKKTNGLIVLLDGTAVGGGLSSSNLSAGAPSWTSGGETSIFGGTAVTTGNALTIVAGAGSTNGLIITQTGSGAALRVNDVTSDTTPLIVDENGHLIVGSTYALSFNNRAAASITSVVPHIAAIGYGAANGASISIFQTNNDVYGGVLSFVKSRGTASSTSQTIAAQGDSLGIIDWQGQATTTATITAAAIEAKINASATISSTSMPGYLTFSTNSGTASPVERMRIDSAGLVGIGKTAPTVALDVNGAITSSSIITGATLTNGTVSITGGAISGATTIAASGTVTAASLSSSGGLVAGGAITGATTIAASGAVTCVGLAAGAGTITTSSTITATGAVTAGSFNASSGGISNAGAIGGATTISASGAVTAGSFNASSGGISNAGAIGGATTILASGNITTSGGTVTANAFATSGGTGAITCASIAATNSITIASSGTSGTLNIWDNTQDSYSTAGIVCNSTAGNSGIGLNCSGATAAYIEHIRGGSGIVIKNDIGGIANLKAAQIDATGDIIAYSTSDRKYKDNIANIANPLDKVAQINGVSFDWNDKQSTFTGRDVGVIAQEVEAVLPEVVTTRDDGTKAVKYDKMVALLIECVKELKAEIEELKSKVN